METPCITLRPETEWVETIAAGANVLVKKRTREAIIEAAGFDFHPRFQERPFGDGRASVKIIRNLLTQFYNN